MARGGWGDLNKPIFQTTLNAMWGCLGKGDVEASNWLTHYQPLKTSDQVSIGITSIWNLMGFRWREFQGNNVSNHIKWFNFIYVLYEIHFKSLKESKRENDFILKTTHYWFFLGGGGGPECNSAVSVDFAIDWQINVHRDFMCIFLACEVRGVFISHCLHNMPWKGLEISV